MSLRKCNNGHEFVKTSDCPVCPICSREEMTKKFGDEFPKIGAPALRALNSIGVTRFSQLTGYSEKQLLELHGFGPRALKMIREALHARGLSLKSL